MNPRQAKPIPLADMLARLGFQPAREVQGERWYRSPVRPRETDPSFKINVARNIWYDCGKGQGSKILDIAMTYSRVSTIPAVLDQLAAPVPGHPALDPVVFERPFTPRARGEHSRTPPARASATPHSSPNVDPGWGMVPAATAHARAP